jgi:arylsulfatase A-like enzyme
VPITPNKRFQGTSQCGLYGDFIHELDWCVGEVLKKLDDLNLAENTLIIFTSDNGGAYYRHKGTAGGRAFELGHRVNGALLGQKADIWEGGHRVPFVARWPARIKPGFRSADVICLTDILATCAAILGRDLPPDAGPDSFNVLPALLGGKHDKPVHDAVVLHSFEGMFAIRQGEWLLIPAQGCGGFSLGNKHDAMTFSELGFKNSDITDDGKIKPDAAPGQLYNLAADPAETTNLYTKQPETVERLTALLGKYKAQKRSGL